MSLQIVQNLILERVWVDVVSFHKTFDHFERGLFDVQMEWNYQVVRPGL